MRNRNRRSPEPLRGGDLRGRQGKAGGDVPTSRAKLQLFAESLDPTDQIALESTGPAMEIARILELHVARVVVATALDVRAISHAGGSPIASMPAPWLGFWRPTCWRRSGCPTPLPRRYAGGWPAAAPWCASALEPRTRSMPPCRDACSAAHPSATCSGPRVAVGSLSRDCPKRRRKRLPAVFTRSTSSVRRSRRSTVASASGLSPVPRRLDPRACGAGPSAAQSFGPIGPSLLRRGSGPPTSSRCARPRALPSSPCPSGRRAHYRGASSGVLLVAGCLDNPPAPKEARMNNVVKNYI